MASDVVWPTDRGVALRVPDNLKRHGGGKVLTPRIVLARANAFAQGHPFVPVSFNLPVGYSSGLGVFEFEGGGNLIVDDEGVHYVISRPNGRVTGALRSSDLFAFSLMREDIVGLGTRSTGHVWLGSETNRAAVLVREGWAVEFDFIAGWLGTGRKKRNEFVEATVQISGVEAREY